MESTTTTSHPEWTPRRPVYCPVCGGRALLLSKQTWKPEILYVCHHGCGALFYYEKATGQGRVR